jgi:hypothetical protein
VDVASAEIKEFLAIIILMGQIKKESLDYWSTDPYFETPIPIALKHVPIRAGSDAPMICPQ